MNKLTLVTAITLALSAGAAYADNNAAWPNPSGKDPVGTVHFHGQVLTNSCKISHDSQNLRVDLPQVMDLEIKADQPIGIQQFQIQVSECPSYGLYKPRVAWDVPSYAVNSDGYLQNKLGSAKNVALKLMDRDDNPVNLNDHNQRFHADSDEGNSRVFTFKVGYVKDRNNIPVTPGKVLAHAKYSVTYQ